MKEEAGRKVGLAGLGHRFPKGNVPMNKGVKSPGFSAGRMSEHWFKKGESRNKLPLGSTRVNSDGYLDRKVADTGYPPRDWKAVHIILWEEAHGRIPAGHRLAFKDRQKAHVTLDNLELVTAAEMMRRNSIHRASLPPELRSVIQIKAVLKRTIRSIERGKKQDVGSAQPPLRDAGSAQGRRQTDGR
jgi:hypothetical protein